MFIAYQDYVQRTLVDLIKENDFMKKKKARSRRYPTKAITDADNVNDQAFLTDIPV